MLEGWRRGKRDLTDQSDRGAVATAALGSQRRQGAIGDRCKTRRPESRLDARGETLAPGSEEDALAEVEHAAGLQDLAQVQAEVSFQKSRSEVDPVRAEHQFGFGLLVRWPPINSS